MKLGFALLAVSLAALVPAAGGARPPRSRRACDCSSNGTRISKLRACGKERC